MKFVLISNLYILYFYIFNIAYFVSSTYVVTINNQWLKILCTINKRFFNRKNSEHLYPKIKFSYERNVYYILDLNISFSVYLHISISSWCTEETRKEKGWERWSVGIELWKKLLDYRVGYYADDAVSLVVIFIPVAHLLRKVFTHMCAPIVSHAERATGKCVCLLRVVDKSAEARGAWWFFKIHSRHAKKRTTGADDRDILSFPSQGSSGVANILNSNRLSIVVYSRPCLFERLGI